MKSHLLYFVLYSIFLFLSVLSVKCQEEIQIMDVLYQVIKYDTATRVLTIKRIYRSDDICSSTKNTILNPSPFKLVPGYKNITIFYGCPEDAEGETCDIEGTRENGLRITSDLASQIPTNAECFTTVTIPADSETLTLKKHYSQQLQKSVLKEILEAGFKVSYENGAAYSPCHECQKIDGICTYNASYKHNCYKGKKKNVELMVGGGVAVFILAFAMFIVCLRRKNKKITTASKLTPQNSSSNRNLKTDLESGASEHFQMPIFSYNELEEATDNFDTKKEVGDGGFGTVYLGKLRDGRDVAVKRLYENNCKRVEQFVNEIRILSRLRHKNLVTLYGCTSRHTRELILVYEFIPNGTVADHLYGERAKPGMLKWPVRLSIAIECADALSYLHASDTIHRDVKSNNILLDNNFHVKVADFGLSRLFPNDVTHISTAPQGTAGYVDPEYYQCYQLTERSDVYSFGVVLCELISSKPAVDINRHRYEVSLANMAMNKIQNQSIHELVDQHLGFNSDYAVRKMIISVAELAYRCLQQDRDTRPSMVEVLETLRWIEKQEYSIEQADEMDIPSDEFSLLKNIPPLSPDSMTDSWVSISTTPNTSSEVTLSVPKPAHSV